MGLSNNEDRAKITAMQQNKTATANKPISKTQAAKNEQLERHVKLRKRELDWEAMMTERIRTESALVRAENEQVKRLMPSASKHPPVSFRACTKRHTLPATNNLDN